MSPFFPLAKFSEVWHGGVITSKSIFWKLFSSVFIPMLSPSPLNRKLAFILSFFQSQISIIILFLSLSRLPLFFSIRLHIYIDSIYGIYNSTWSMNDADVVLDAEYCVPNRPPCHFDHNPPPTLLYSFETTPLPLPFSVFSISRDNIP